MRVALVTTSWPSREGDPSGHFVRAEARALERAGHQVTVFAAQGEAFGWPGVGARLRERPLRAFGVVTWIAKARAAVGRGGFDRVISHWAVPCAWPIAIGAAELEVVSHGGDVRALLALPRILRGWIVRSIASRATVWRFVSEALRSSLIAGLAPKDARAVERIARVEPCAIEMPDVADAIASRRGELGGKRAAVAVGRLVASKAVDRVIERVARARTEDVLVIVGDGPERARLEALAEARGIDARFVGMVDREVALSWIGAAEVLIHASRAEGLSTVIREARALGVRVEEIGDATRPGSPPGRGQ